MVGAFLKALQKIIGTALYYLFYGLSKLAKFKSVFVIGFWLFVAVILSSLLGLKWYQHNWDDDPDRGAIAMLENGGHGENYKTPIYLYNKDTGKPDQNWNASDSLWFYNTTQGSGLIPYDFFLVLEQANSDELFRSDENMDRLRYLPQKPTPFNPDGLPVGFVKDTYRGGMKWYQAFSKGRDYVGFTCAACHTSQVNYTDPTTPDEPATAIRIDGGPAMADMVSFLEELEAAMTASLTGEKRDRFIENVLALENDYSSSEQVLKDLNKWTDIILAYNTINDSHVAYGYARLDAFGRIYNRVLQHVIGTEQLRQTLAMAIIPETGKRILSPDQLDLVFKDIPTSVIVSDEDAAKVLRRVYRELGLSNREIYLLRDSVFNEADAPVSYPFLWDIAQSTYVQWNGLANNSGVGPLGRNAGEVVGVFGILDWQAEDPGFSLSSRITGQSDKNKRITFDSSIDISNLQRLERKLVSLQSPSWPTEIVGKIDLERAKRGEVLYEHYCSSCHEVIDPSNAGRIVVSSMSDIDLIGTDPVAAQNGVNYTGNSGNLEDTYQSIAGVGPVVIQEKAPAIQILTSAVEGVIATPDPDKWFFVRWAERIYNIVASLFDNPIKNSIKAGNYKPDTSANPYDSLLAYKARSLNGIWATGPYLHNGSVPTLYDLLLPADCSTADIPGECRPETFYVGSREFDPQKVGFKYDAGGADANFTLFDTKIVGNSNKGHEYAAGKTPQLDGKTILPALSRSQRLDLLEYLKQL